MTGAIDILVREHALVLGGLDLLARAARAGSTADAQIARLLDFCDELLDQHHHAKEERELFPALVAAGLPLRAGPVAVMLGEHDEGRSMVSSMRSALAAGDRARLADRAAAFAALLRAHVEKENGILFPMAARLVPAATLADMAARWRAAEGVESRWRDELATIDRALR